MARSVSAVQRMPQSRSSQPPFFPDGECVIDNLPDIDDVMVLKKTLSMMGAKIETPSKNALKIDATPLPPACGF